jgi:hypothetical protein
MNEAKRPTPEAIEAALSAYEPIADESTGELSEDTRTFINLMFQNDRLRLELMGIFNAIGCPEGSDPNDWQKLALEGHVNPTLMQKITFLCDMFFWIGWHSRGAVEEAEQLRRLADA